MVEYVVVVVQSRDLGNCTTISHEELMHGVRTTHYPPTWSGALLQFKFHLLFRLASRSGFWCEADELGMAKTVAHSVVIPRIMIFDRMME